MHLALDLDLDPDAYPTVREHLVALSHEPHAQLDEEGAVLRLRLSRPLDESGIWLELQTYWLVNDDDAAGRLLVRAHHAQADGLATSVPPPDPELPDLLKQLTQDKLLCCGDLKLGRRYGCPPEKAQALLAHLRDERRLCPTVVTADPAVGAIFAQQLGPLALVINIDDDVVRHLKGALDGRLHPGPGLVRVYWPGLRLDRGPKHGRLIISGCNEATRNRLAREAATRIARTRARWAPMSPPEDMVIEAAVISRRVEAKSAELREKLESARHQPDTNENQQLWNDLSGALDERDALLIENEGLKTELIKMHAQLERHEYEARRKRRSADHADATLPPPSTLREAVERAKAHHTDDLVFGDDVMSTVEAMQPNAGPPSKVLKHLAALAELARAKRRGRSIGLDEVRWLADKGVNASGESDTVRHSDKAQRARTWHDGERRRVFDMHLKPNGGTDTDRCVRIYYAWDDTAQIFRIGAVGRHP